MTSSFKSSTRSVQGRRRAGSIMYASATATIFAFSDIWESRDAFEKFGETLKPLMQDLGLDPPQIEFFEVHNIIQGRNSSLTAS